MRRLALLAAVLLSACGHSPVGGQEIPFVADCRGGPEIVRASHMVRDGECVRFYNRFGNVVYTACGCGRVVEGSR